MQKKTKPKILFISHKSSRSGAPILLLEIIKEFKKQSDISFKIILRENGVLAEEFKKLGPTYFWYAPNVSLFNGRFLRKVNSLISKIGMFTKSLWLLFLVRRTTVTFSNTITNGELHKKLLFLKSKFICYVHELEAAIYISTNTQSLKTVLDNTNLFLACSEAVKKNLVHNHNINAEKVIVVSSPMMQVYRDKNDYADFKKSFKTKNVIPADARIIGIAGTNEWRKGFDLFFPLALVYFNMFPGCNTYFVWKGITTNTYSSFFDMYDYKEHITNRHVLLLPHDSDSIATISCFDIHLLLSREDPYPLVMLEAASFGIPTVCFADAGGSPEFIEDDCGYCVPYCDLIKMAVSLNKLIKDDKLRNTMGLKAQQKVKLRHAKENVIPEFIKLLEN